MPKFSGAWPVIPTPYDAQMNIDCGVYRELIHWYIQRGVGGLYANCLSSEMYALSPAERLLLVRETAEASAGRTPVAATGNFGPDLDADAVFCREVAQAGADVVMLVIPPYLKDDTELGDYLFRLAERVDAPLGLYECPVPRAYHLGVDLVRRLAQSGRFFAFKETACDLEKIRALVEVTNGTPLAYLQANTPYLLEATRLGAPGTMSIAAGIVPELVGEVIRLAQQGDPRAAALHDRLTAFELAERQVHPLGVKYLLAKRGLPISMRSRTAKEPLSGEVQCALDACARLYFSNGE
jgi:4-hydroxy-tetrahydrodipicolinate synthase